MRKDFFLLAWAALLVSNVIFSQSPYTINWKSESAFLGMGVLSTGTGFLVASKVSPLSPEAIADLNRSAINGFDRQATFNYSPAAANLSDALLIGSHALPGIFLLNKESRSDFDNIALLYGETYLLTSGLTLLSKSLTLRTRPYIYNERTEDRLKVMTNARFSFFSGHTSITTANCFFVAKVFSDYFPNSKMKPYVWGMAITIPAVTAYLRVASGKHFPTDVIFGYGIGAAIGMLIPHLHSKQKDTKVTFYPGFGRGSLMVRLNN